ncbi:hypothetical protein BKA80DRAFT_123821 [Phyllosticta citrichinensis]
MRQDCATQGQSRSPALVLGVPAAKLIAGESTPKTCMVLIFLLKQSALRPRRPQHEDHRPPGFPNTRPGRSLKVFSTISTNSFPKYRSGFPIRFKQKRPRIARVWLPVVRPTDEQNSGSSRTLPRHHNFRQKKKTISATNVEASCVQWRQRPGERQSLLTRLYKKIVHALNFGSTPHQPQPCPC